MKRILLFGLLGGLLATGSGCGLMQAIFCYRPCVMQGDCAPGVYDETCGEDCDGLGGPNWGPARAPVFAPRRAWGTDDCGVECGRPCRGPYCRRCAPCDDPCGDPCWDPCGECCYGRCWHRGPLSCLFALMFRGCWWGPSCGERYWGDFYSDPPDCWDPCDCYGNYTGGVGCRPGDCRQARRINKYGGGYMDYGMSAGEEQIVSEGERVVSPESPSPTPAPRPHNAAKKK